MSDIIQGVLDLTEQVLSTEPSNVKIDKDKVEELGEMMKNNGPIFFGNEEPEYTTGIYYKVLKELVATSINYCYWYGSHSIRPNESSSTTMYENVEEVFGEGKHALMFENKIDELIERLAVNRFPLLEERKRHLLELCDKRRAETFTELVCSKAYSGRRLFYEMMEMFPGFASDIFLKRASLFFIQLYRKFKWYKDSLMIELFVPADYQVPKILKHFGCMEYSEELQGKIDNSILIKKHSLEEIQIRAATIKICKKLQNITGWLMPDIDTYLWCNRKLTDDPFHLTITSDY